MRLSDRKFWSDWGWLVALLVIKLGLQLISAGQYGFHRDEYLYLVQGEHLAWGYMEVPPVIAWVAAAVRLFGDNIYLIKLVPAVAGAFTMILVALMTRDLGGKRWAQFVACLAFLLVPAYLRTHHLFQPVFLNQLMWVWAMYLLIRIVKSGSSGSWYWLGLVMGLGFLTKYSILFLALATGLALLLTPQRSWYRRREPYLALALALLIAFPNLLWQYAHNFPVLAHMEELRDTQLVHVDPVSFIVSQFLMLFGATLLWMPGLIALLRARTIRGFRVLGFVYLVVLVLLLIFSGKDYYMLGIYPPLIAAGAVWWQGVAGNRKWVRIALPLVILLLSMPVIPYGIPVLSIEKMQRYCAFMKDSFGLSGPLVWEDGVERPLPQDYADMHGWEEMVRRTANVYHDIDPAERARCNLWGGSYSHASTINFYRHKYDLPEAYSFVGSHVLWIPDSLSFDLQIMLDDVRSLESSYFADVQLLDSIRNPFAREKGYVYLRKEPKVDVTTEWQRLVVENRDRWFRK